MYAVEYILGNKPVYQKISRATHPAEKQEITFLYFLQVEVASDVCIRSVFSWCSLCIRQLNVGILWPFYSSKRVSL